MVDDLDPSTLLHTILEGIGQPFYAVDRDWRIILYNGDAARHFGRPASEMIGRIFWDIFGQDHDSSRGRALTEAMTSRTILRGEGPSMVGQRWVSYSMFPLGDGLGVIFHDVTDRKRAEERHDHAEETLRKRTVELETVLETIPTAVWFTYDRDVKSLIGNRRGDEMLHAPRGSRQSFSATQGRGRPFHLYRDGEEAEPGTLPLQRAARGEEVIDDLLEVRFDSGERLLLLFRAAPLLGASGEIQGAVSAAADVTEQHRYEEHLKLLLDELNHRVKNTLASVQSIAALTLKGTAPVARADFERRLLTLASVHNLLADANWEGVRLHALTRATLRPYLGGARPQLTMTGEDFLLRPKSAEALAMALHELCTNAAKYGALSTEQGNVDLRWTTTDDRFRLRWAESGGPTVTAPKQAGFGARLIEHGLADELQGEVRLDYRPQGVVCTIDAPLAVIRDGAGQFGIGLA